MFDLENEGQGHGVNGAIPYFLILKMWVLIIQYTICNLTIGQSMATIKICRCTNICASSYHLPYNVSNFLTLKIIGSRSPSKAFTMPPFLDNSCLIKRVICARSVYEILANQINYQIFELENEGQRPEKKGPASFNWKYLMLNRLIFFHNYSRPAKQSCTEDTLPYTDNAKHMGHS